MISVYQLCLAATEKSWDSSISFLYLISLRALHLNEFTYKTVLISSNKFSPASDFLIKI